jgi:hypothetical protein
LGLAFFGQVLVCKTSKNFSLIDEKGKSFALFKKKENTKLSTQNQRKDG